MIDDIAAFVAVAENKSVTAAARRLRQPKSTLSLRVTQLEQRLGVTLLQRTTRSMNLTEAGAEFYRRCARIMAEIEDAERLVQQEQSAPSGTLRVVTTIEFGMLAMGRLVGDFVRRHPACRIEIDLRSGAADLVEEGFDLAIRIGDLADSTMISRKLISVRRALYASPDYLARCGQPSAPAELKHFAFLRYVAPQSPPRIPLRRKGERSAAGIDAVLAANNLTVLRDAAIAGAGIALLPSFLCTQAVAQGRLVPVLAGWQVDPVAVTAVYPSKRLLAPKTAAFVAFLIAELRKHGDRVFAEVSAPAAPRRKPKAG